MSGVGGPWLTSAVFCTPDSKADLEVTDRVGVRAGTPIKVVLVMFVVRGDHAGRIPLVIEAMSPSHEPAGRIAIDVDPTEGPADASRIVVPIDLGLVRAGVYWFSVATGERVLTKLPLHVAVLDS
jgi:hypothetical protein